MLKLFEAPAALCVGWHLVSESVEEVQRKQDLKLGLAFCISMCRRCCWSRYSYVLHTSNCAGSEKVIGSISEPHHSSSN